VVIEALARQLRGNRHGRDNRTTTLPLEFDIAG